MNSVMQKTPKNNNIILSNALVELGAL